MNKIDIIKRASRNLSQSKGRTILTALAIAVGAFTLTLSLAIGAGTRSYLSKIMDTNVNKQAIVVYADKNLVSTTGGGSGAKEYDPNAAQYGGGYSYKTLGVDDVKKLANNKDISQVIPTYNVSIEYFQVDGNSKKYTASVAAYDSTVRSDTAAGTLPSLNEQIGDNQIVIPESFISSIGLKNAQDAIGKKIVLHVVNSRQLSSDELENIYANGGVSALSEATSSRQKDVTYTIAAVTAKPSTAISSTNQLSISLNQAKDLSEYVTQGTSSYQRYMTVGVLVKDGVNPTTVKDELSSNGMYAMTAEDMQGMLFSIVNVVQAIVAGFGVLALLASMFGIVNTQYISVLERTGQIGLMKALGMSNRGVGKLFRYEAAWIGFFGGVIGAGLAAILGTIFNPLITTQLKLGAGNNLLIFEPIPILLLIIFLIIIAVLAGWFPSRKAAKLNPIEALRTE